MDIVIRILLLATLPGAIGALAWFLCGIRNGWIRNNKYKRKAVLEMVGGLLVASCVAYPMAPLFAGSTPIVVLSFAMGACWSGIMQALRGWITHKLSKFLNGEDT